MASRSRSHSSRGRLNPVLLTTVASVVDRMVFRELPSFSPLSGALKLLSIRRITPISPSSPALQ